MRHLLGIGCQRLAFDQLGIEVEMVGISEIDKYALQSYMAIYGDTKNFGSICDIQSLPEVDVFTWSFPCTDLSKAGKQKGLTNTRSGLVYEVLRILHNTEHKPKVLIMENVVDLVQTKFIREFQSIQHELELMGYTNYAETMNAKDYGVAQNRDRVFMVSILGEYYYEFPKPFPLEKKWKDYKEDNVDEKYYIKSDLIEHIEKTGVDRGNYIQYDRYNGEFESLSRVWRDIAPTLHTKCNEIKMEVEDDSYLVILEDCGKKLVKKTDVALTLMARDYKGFGNQGMTAVVEKTKRVRRLTPLEAWRLMGIDDKCYHKARKVCSSSQLYKQAGNGIVVDVFAQIVGKMKDDNRIKKCVGSVVVRGKPDQPVYIEICKNCSKQECICEKEKI